MKKVLPKYKITIDDMYSDGEDLGISKIAHTANPAIKKKGFAFNEVKKVKGIFADDLKYRISGPIMKRMDIYRYDDESDEEYEVEFEKEVIDELFVKFMSRLDNTKSNFNDEHEDIDAPSFVLFAWPEENGDEIWVTTQFTDKDIYNQYVEEGKTGYSIEGFLGMKMSEFIKTKKNNKHTMKNNVKTKFTEVERADGGKIFIDGDIAVGSMVYDGLPSYQLIDGVKSEIRYPVWCDTYELADGTGLILADSKIIEIVNNSNTSIDTDTSVGTELEDEKKDEEKVENTKLAEAEKKDEEEEEDKKDVETELEDEEKDDEKVVESYSKEELDAKFDEIYQMIAELKAGNTEVEKEDLSKKEQKMSIHESFANMIKFSRENKVLK